MALSLLTIFMCISGASLYPTGDAPANSTDPNVSEDDNINGPGGTGFQYHGWDPISDRHILEISDNMKSAHKFFQDNLWNLIGGCLAIMAMSLICHRLYASLSLATSRAWSLTIQLYNSKRTKTWKFWLWEWCRCCRGRKAQNIELTALPSPNQPRPGDAPVQNTHVGSSGDAPAPDTIPEIVGDAPNTDTNGESAGDAPRNGPDAPQSIKKRCFLKLAKFFRKLGWGADSRDEQWSFGCEYLINDYMN